MEPPLELYGQAVGGLGLSLPDLSAESRPSRTSRLAQTVRALGYSDTEVNTAIERLQGARGKITFDSLIDTASAVKNELIETGSAPSSLECFRENCDPVMEDTGGNLAGQLSVRPKHKENLQPPTDELRKQLLRKAIEKRKMELRDAIESLTYRCRMCNYARATILLLPCGHLASCDDCLMDVRRCPIPRCNKVVRGTKEVYFV